MTPTPDSGGPWILRCRLGPASVPERANLACPGLPLARGRGCRGAGPPRANNLKPLDTRLGMGSGTPTPHGQPEPEQPPYRAASALPARGKGATGFPGRTNRASDLARVPRAREIKVGNGGPTSLRAMGLRFRRDGRIYSEGAGRQREKLGAHGCLFLPRPSFSRSVIERGKSSFLELGESGFV